MLKTTIGTVILALLSTSCFSQVSTKTGTINAAGAACGAAGVCVVFANIPQNTGSATITVSNIGSQTIVFEAAGDANTPNGPTYFGIGCTNQTTGATGVTSTTSNAVFQCSLGAYTNIQARGSTYSSGGATVTINVSQASARIIGPVGPTGPVGATGPTGATGTVTTVNGMPLFGGVAPTMGTCGTASISGPGAAGVATNNSFSVNVTSGTPTSCAVSFGQNFTNSPTCVASSNSSSISVGISAKSASSVTFSLPVAFSGFFYASCF